MYDFCSTFIKNIPETASDKKIWGKTLGLSGPSGHKSAVSGRFWKQIKFFFGNSEQIWILFFSKFSFDLKLRGNDKNGFVELP